MVRDRRTPSNKHPGVQRLPDGMRCVHHWLFEEPSGPTVKGVCCKCGATDELPSSYQGWSRDDSIVRGPTHSEVIHLMPVD